VHARIAAAAVVVVLGVPAAASDVGAAKKLVISTADVGPGFTSAARPAAPPVLPKIAACVGKSVAKRKVSVTVDGPDLTNSADGTVIGSTVEIVQTASMAAVDVRVFKSPKFPGCVKQVLGTRLSGQGIMVVYVTPDPLLARKQYGTYTGAFDAQFKLADGSLQHTTEVGIVKGRAEIDASLVSSGGSVDVSTLRRALDKLGKRLKHVAV
jgi:hypothetical protein